MGTNYSRVAVYHLGFTIQSLNDIHNSQEIKIYTGYLMRVTGYWDLKLKKTDPVVNFQW